MSPIQWLYPTWNLGPSWAVRGTGFTFSFVVVAMECVSCYEPVVENCSTCVHPQHAKCAATYLSFNPSWNKRCFICHKGQCVFDAPPAQVRPDIGQIPPELAGVEGLKTCPGCGTGVMKNGGCDFVRCRCGVSFRFSNRTVGSEGAVFLLFLGWLVVWFFTVLVLAISIETSNRTVGSCVSQQPRSGLFCTTEEERLRLVYRETRLECTRQHTAMLEDFQRFERRFPALRDMYLDWMDAQLYSKSSCMERLKELDRTWSVRRVFASVYRLFAPLVVAYFSAVRLMVEYLYFFVETPLTLVVQRQLAHFATHRIVLFIAFRGFIAACRLYQ